MLDAGGMSIKFCSGFFNLLYRRYPPIANPNTLRPPTYYALINRECGPYAKIFVGHAVRTERSEVGAA